MREKETENPRGKDNRGEGKRGNTKTRGREPKLHNI
jgi:hypothetical protein